MKKTVFLIALAAFGMGMNSCSNDNELPGSASRNITVATSINTMTRVATDNNGNQIFSEGDQISIYAWTGDAAVAPAASDRAVDNAINTLASGAWVAAPQMLWKNTTDAHYFVGVWPKNEASVANLDAVTYTLDVGNQAKSDLLVATNKTGLKSQDNPVLLTFNHVMAKLNVNLQFRNQWDGTPTVESVTVKDAASNATVDYLTQTVTASATTGDIILPVVKDNETYSSIVIPQTGIKSIVIRIGDKDYTYTNPDGIKLESGKITNVSLIVGRDEITLGEVSINNWTDGSTIEGGEAQE